MQPTNLKKELISWIEQLDDHRILGKIEEMKFKQLRFENGTFQELMELVSQGLSVKDACSKLKISPHYMYSRMSYEQRQRLKDAKIISQN